jgi:Glycosyl hydrolases family 2, sugar binding domain/Glycosyl hydrolases family 2/Glycosyl hydrolases family 2, TIM barrel domain
MPRQKLTRFRFALLAVLTLPLLFGASFAAADEPFADPAWRYTVRKPARGWQAVKFDDRSWRTGPGGFGTPGTPGARVGTLWTTRNIWLRRTVVLKAVPKNAALYIHHDEDAEVFLNGTQVAALKGYITNYKVVPLDAKQRAALRPGKNLVAVHCRQTGGGQFIDVHVVDAKNLPKLPPPKPQTKPFESKLITKWGKNVTPENAWTEYPRPQFVRGNWRNLNGKWDYAITPIKQTQKPAKWAGKILVPFCLESRLSGVRRLLDPTEALWYRRMFPAKRTAGRRTMLNFEAVDYRCRVWVNGKPVGSHVGGNTPFQFDVTAALKDGDNELLVRVEDATADAQLRGKQRLMPHGIWYTRVSGIWQTVWLEEVPARSLKDVKISTDPVRGTITVRPIPRGRPGAGERLRVIVTDDGKTVGETVGGVGELTVAVKRPKLWSPASPHLYGLKIALLDGNGKVLDEVSSYAGIRSVGKVRDKQGHLRFTLNGKVLFHWGTLDQGWWPDGLLTPPSDEAMQFDIRFLKSAGFNMIRKHIKVEPRRYYYHCDRLGMLLWQDQVSGGRNPPWTRLQANPKDAVWSDRDHAEYLREFEAMVATLENHPSIVVWVPFNEAWGQHRTVQVGKWIAKRDPSRLVNIASGGNFWPVGDVVDQHRYPHPGFPFAPKRYRDYIKVVGEFGGHGWPVKGHLWDADRANWGYGGLPKTVDEYKARYRESIRRLAELRDKGIAGGVYTQTTDVEGEINGLLTYDRGAAKIPAAELRRIHAGLLRQ